MILRRIQISKPLNTEIYLIPNCLGDRQVSVFSSYGWGNVIILSNEKSNQRAGLAVQQSILCTLVVPVIFLHVKFFLC